jgi:hypothetical protein
VFETLADSFATALHTLNQTLGQAVDKAEARAEQAKAKTAEPQPIEIVETKEEAPTESESEEE